jgi:hypothetical protein
MRVPFKIVLIASGYSVIAEGLAWFLVSITARTASDGVVFRFCVWFHGAGDALRFYLFRSIENHPTPVQEIAMMFSFFGVALLQWFLIFLLGFALVRPLTDWHPI